MNSVTCAKRSDKHFYMYVSFGFVLGSDQCTIATLRLVILLSQMYEMIYPNYLCLSFVFFINYEKTALQIFFLLCKDVFW